MSKPVLKIASVVVAALVLVAVTVTLVKRSDSDSVPVTAVFADSSPLTAGNKVQCNGVEVGKISEIRLVNGTAHVVMALDRSVLPLHVDAGARIEPVSLLGERFIALNQGTPSTPITAEPVTIGIQRTSSSVDVDELLNTLDDPTSAALASMVTTFGEGVAGQGDNVAQAMRALAPTLQRTDQLSRLLDQQNAVLDRLLVQGQKDATAFAAPLDSLVGSANTALSATAADRQALDDTVVELPGTLTSAQRALAKLRDTGNNGADMLEQLHPLTDNLVDVSRELYGFSDSAAPALDALPPVLDRLNEAMDRLRPVVGDLKPAAGDLATASAGARQLSDQIFTHALGKPSQAENLLTGAANWAMATSGYDGVSHYFRGLALVTPSTLGNSGAALLPPVTKQPPFNPVKPDPNGKSGYPGTAPLPFLAPVGPNLDGEDNSSYSPPAGDRFDHPTTPAPGKPGMTPKQENDMFGQLLGGGR